MNLECLNDIITTNLAIHIDLTSDKSWVNYNTGLTAFSLTKWSGAISDNLNLFDFGLTAFDNGRTDTMWSGTTITPSDTLFSMYKVGFNEVQNPTTGETSGLTATTFYYPISAVTTGDSENYYFELDGGYLQGFFKLDGFNYELFPARYGSGITIETILYLYPESHGIFYMMGARAEDKYNPYFSGETMTGKTVVGVNTSFDNYLDAFNETLVHKKAFRLPEESKTTKYTEPEPIENLKNNVIAFEITQDRKLAYKYINNDGIVVRNISTTSITPTGFTMISIVYTPDNIIRTPNELKCDPQRTGRLVFFVNGRSIWTIKEFPEFYFKPMLNDKEKQIGVPYSISWGGGSFGLKHSWHYDFQTYILYNSQDTNYINSNFFVQENPISTECNPDPSDEYLSGLSLSADSTTFIEEDPCDSTVEIPQTVMRIEYTGTTGQSKSYFIKFEQPISVLSNRDYTLNLSLYDDEFFKGIDDDGKGIDNKISILVYSYTVDINILNDSEYKYPLRESDLAKPELLGLHPFPDKAEYQYVKDGIMYFGKTGIPVTDAFSARYGYSFDGFDFPTDSSLITGQKKWVDIESVFRTPDNVGQQFIFAGILIETSDEFNENQPLFIKNFSYTAADILVQDERKENQLIEQNFDSGFIGGIQKLRIYNNALNSSEVLHNAIMESQKNSNIVVNKGGRIIYR